MDATSKLLAVNIDSNLKGYFFHQGSSFIKVNFPENYAASYNAYRGVTTLLCTNIHNNPTLVLTMFCQWKEEHIKFSVKNN